jgi:hypothetical protein
MQEETRLCSCDRQKLSEEGAKAIHSAATTPFHLSCFAKEK